MNIYNTKKYQYKSIKKKNICLNQNNKLELTNSQLIKNNTINLFDKEHIKESTNDDITSIFIDNITDLNGTDNIITNNIKTERKYKSDFRKKLITKFSNIIDKNILLDIYNIIINDIGTNFSSNINGIFINMNILSDNCIEKLIKYLDEYINNTNSDSKSDKINCKLYKIDDIDLLSEIGHKLSNQEKNIIKRIRNKNVN